MREHNRWVFIALGCVCLAAASACIPSDDDAGGDDEDEVADPEPVPRRVMHEMFTGANCGPCEPGDANLEAVLDANEDRMVVMKYQIGSDRYMTREGVDRRMYYLPGESSYGIPFVHADGEPVLKDCGLP